MKANYVRGRGDYMGMAGALNDGADITADVFAYTPNDYGLYNMAGNVNEWVADVYRPLSPLDVEEFQPYRGNVITEYRRDNDEDIIFDQYGQPVVDTIADYRNYVDGDYRSNMIEGNDWSNTKPENIAQSATTTDNMYVQSDVPGVISSRINDRSRVYKGGSWRDRAYWLNPGSRRHLDQSEAKANIGFRCAMTRLGPPNVANK
jgi:sulfatase modifying factor 1